MYQGAQRKTKLSRKEIMRRRRRKACCTIFIGTLGVMVCIILGLGSLIHVRSQQLPQDVEEECAKWSKEKVFFTEEEELVVPEEERAEPERDIPMEKPLLVNKDNPLPKDYAPELITLPDGRSKAAEEAYESLCEFLEAAEDADMDILICSSYRSRERQQELYDEDVQKLLRKGYTYTEACAEVEKETMPPGCSEHSTGLAFDIVARDYQLLDAGQEKRAENKWLRKHCAEYGFILRYPKGKEDITDISYESWHFRYVGEEVAKYIMEEGITLEEYLGK